MTSIESVAIEKSVETAQGLFNKLFGPSFEEYGLMWADNVKVRRLRNQIKNLGKIDKIVSENNLTLKDVNLKVLVPYIENVSLEEDEVLQDMWANLMTSYVDSSKNLTTTVYPGILSQLSSEEVRIMNELRNSRDKSFRAFYPDWPDVMDKRRLLNLLRLGLIEEVHQIEQRETSNRITGAPELEVKYKNTNKFRQTEFGASLLDVCER